MLSLRHKKSHNRLENVARTTTPATFNQKIWGNWWIMVEAGVADRSKFLSEHRGLTRKTVTLLNFSTCPLGLRPLSRPSRNAV